MISRFQPHASSMEAGSNGKPYQNLMSISAKQNFNSNYHYMLFDSFLNFSLKWPASMEAGGWGRVECTFETSGMIILSI